MENQKKLRTRDGIIDLSNPLVMGILNLTPDSFYDGGKYTDGDAVMARVGKMLEEGATIIDIGGMSTRPGSTGISPEEELERLLPALQGIRKHYPDAFISVDTYRGGIARECIGAGAHMINDISGGQFDPSMHAAVADLDVPYVMMHIQGTPATMQKNPAYVDVVAEVKLFFEGQLNKLRKLGVTDNVVIDPGFGFGKTVGHNFTLLAGLREFKSLGCPVLAGASRKSMINKALGIKPEEALNGTTVVNTMALMNGADILRVHDVREAAEAVRLINQYNSTTQ